MLNGRIFKQITGKDYKEFIGNPEGLIEAVQSEHAEKMRRIIRGPNYDNPIRFFNKDGSGGGFESKLNSERGRFI